MRRRSGPQTRASAGLRTAGLLTLLFGSGASACGSGSDMPDAGGPGDLGLDGGRPELPARPAIQTCRFEGTPEGAIPRRVAVRAELPRIAAPISFGGSSPGQWLVADQAGMVHVLEPSTGTSTRALDLAGDRIVGLVGRSGELFVQRIVPAPSARMRISRFRTSPRGVAERGSEVVLLELDPIEDGGGLLFDPDGNLLIALGDGGDPSSAGDLSRLPGSLLRIDVSSVESSGVYQVPPDNPFVGRVGLREEIWAYGFRAPRDCALDDTGAVLCVDAAPSGQQEVNRVIAGANYGWPRVQGVLCRPEGGACDDQSLRVPLVAHPLGGEDCGAVGGALIDEGSAYVFADRCSGRLFGFRWPIGSSAEVESLGRLDEGVIRLLSGEAETTWVLGGSGDLFELVPRSDQVDFPARLSESGCFEDLQTARPGPDLVPYDILSPLWTDGAYKRRWMVIPPGESITAPAEGPWSFPLGSILIKEFAFDRREGSIVRRRPVETRVMLKTEEGWDFHSYRWTADGTDAELLSESRMVDLDVEILGVAESVPYLFPSRFDCKICHGPATSGALGPVSLQMDRQRDYGGASAPQLEMLSSIGVIDRVVTASTPMVDPADETAEIELRARSYLHANCAHCHQPGGWVPPDLDIDLRFETALTAAGICGVARNNSGPTDAGEYRVAPGRPEDSTVYGRMVRRDVFQMPPLATSRVDPTGEEVLRTWIEQLGACP